MTRREFPKSVKDAAWKRCQGQCEHKDCTRQLERHEAEFDHILACGLGGGATLENCAVLCIEHHKQKTAQEDIWRMAKADRANRKLVLGQKRKSRPIPGSKASGWRKRMDGRVERR